MEPTCYIKSRSLSSQSHRPSGLRRGLVAARLFEMRVRIPPGAWTFVFVSVCVCTKTEQEKEFREKNPTGGMVVCILCVLCVVRQSLRRADHPSRGVQPTVVCHCVWSRNHTNEFLSTSEYTLNVTSTNIACFYHKLVIQILFLVSNNTYVLFCLEVSRSYSTRPAHCCLSSTAESIGWVTLGHLSGGN